MGKIYQQEAQLLQRNSASAAHVLSGFRIKSTLDYCDETLFWISADSNKDALK